MELKYYEQYHDLCLQISKQLKSRNQNEDIKDIYQECWLELLKHTDKGYEIPYLYKTVYNNVSKKILYLRYGTDISYKVLEKVHYFRKLLEQGYTKKQIMQYLNIAESTYNLINYMSSYKFSLQENILSCDRNSDKNLILEEISEFILEQEFDILLSHFYGKSNKQIGLQYGKTDEWVRLKIIEIVEKLRNYYNERDRNQTNSRSYD